MVKVCLIVAVSSNQVIGVKNQLPWHLSEDLKYFKRVTLGKPVIMGRKTFESIGRALPKRSNIVVTSSKDWHAPGVEVCMSLNDGLAQAKKIAEGDGVNEVMIIGGEQIYRQALDWVERIYLTKVEVVLEGDAHFPELDPQSWDEHLVAEVAATKNNPAYRFLVLERLNAVK